VESTIISTSHETILKHVSKFASALATTTIHLWWMNIRGNVGDNYYHDLSLCERK
jgi:hypothetical protein